MQALPIIPQQNSQHIGLELSSIQGYVSNTSTCCPILVGEDQFYRLLSLSSAALQSRDLFGLSSVWASAVGFMVASPICRLPHAGGECLAI